jgi:hypothetical protein
MMIPPLHRLMIACDLRRRTHKNNLLAAALRPVQRGVTSNGHSRVHATFGSFEGFYNTVYQRFWNVHFAK